MDSFLKDFVSPRQTESNLEKPSRTDMVKALNKMVIKKATFARKVLMNYSVN